MENRQEHSDNYIELAPLMGNMRKYARKLWFVIVLVMLLSLAAFFLTARVKYVPKYKAEVVFSVSLNYSGTTDILNNSYYYDTAAAKYIADSFPYILNSDVMIESLLQELGVPRINGTITATSVAGTNLFVVNVLSSSPEDAYNILNAIIDVYPQVSRKVIGDTQLTINTPPEYPSLPYTSFGLKSCLLKGFAVGLVLSFLLVLIPALLNRTIISAEDVKKIANMNCLAGIPDMTKKRSSKSGSFLLLNRQSEDSSFREAFRLLHLKLIRETKKDGSKVIMFTSSLPSEGKSSIAANAAISLAESGKRVVLIDGDLRAPNVKALFEFTEPSVGLGECLRDNVSRLNLLVDKKSGLYVFAGSESNEDPVPLFRNTRLDDLMKAMRNSFDYVIIDTPPCVYMADAAALCRYADKVVYVIREDYVTGSQLQEGIRSLSDNGAKICGFVLNRITGSFSGGHGYGHSYGYGYGYGYGYKHGYGSNYKYGYGYKSGYENDKEKSGKKADA